MNWKKSIIFFTSFLVFFFGEIALNIACGPEQDPYDYYVSFFHNNVQGDEYKPFAFNGMLFLNSEEEVQDESLLNSAEWAKYLSVKQNDVHKVMYGVDSATSVKLLKFTGKSMLILPDSLRKNTFLLMLTKKKDALNYYRFVKKLEPMMIATGYWYAVQRDSATLVKGAATAEALMAKSVDGFLKLRYAYQAQRMYRYANRTEESIRVYEKYIANVQSVSSLKGWAMAIYAGALRFTGQADKAAYLFSKVFASNPERRIMAYRNYFWTDAKIGDVLKFTKTDNEKANIYAINGFRKPDSDIQHLKETYECNPTNPLVGALLIREVNKLEQNLIEKNADALGFVDAYTSRYSYYEKNQDSLKTANLKHLGVVRDFALKLAAEKKYTNFELGYITAAYLSWIAKNDELALNYLFKINISQLSVQLHDQYRIIELLIKANQIKKGSTFSENKLLPALKWLDEKRYRENKSQSKDQYGYDYTEGNVPFTKTARDFYQQVLAPAYMKMGDTAKAAMAMLKGDLKFKLIKYNSFEQTMSYQTITFWHQFLTPRTMKIIENFKFRHTQQTLEGLLAKCIIQVKNDEFYELYGTSYLRAHQYAKAIACFNKISENYKYWRPSNWWSAGDGEVKLIANSFITTINDYPKKYAKQANGISKKSFAQEMLRLQKLITSDKKNASLYYYKMANAVYQTAFFGNSWYFISYDWTSFDNDGPLKYYYDADYKHATTAKQWYLKARSLSKDENFKAMCTFMLAKCEQKRMINQDFNTKIQGDQGSYESQTKVFMAMNMKNPYFNEMKSTYAKTPFYKIATGECSYLRDFIKSH